MTTQSRIALITGANRGLGKAAALRLAADGTDLIITYRSHAEEAEAVVAEATALGRTAVALRLDAGEVGTFDAFAGEVGRVLKESWDRDTFDHLVNNAGVGIGAPFAEMAVEDFDALMNVHFRGSTSSPRSCCR